MDRRLLYAIPAAVLTATVVLAALALAQAVASRELRVAGFLFQASGVVSSVQRSAWPGPAAGVGAGDRVVAVEGRPIADGRALRSRLQAQPVERPVALRLVSRAEGRAYQVSLPVRPLGRGDFVATFVLPYSIGAMYLLLGAAIFFVRRSYAAALAMSVCVLAAVYYLTLFDAHTTFVFSRLWVSYPLLGAVSVHLFCVFPRRLEGVHRPGILAIPYAAAMAVVALLQARLSGSPAVGWAGHLASGFLAVCFLVDLGLLTVAARRDPSERVRNKATAIRIGLLVTLAGGLLWSLLLARLSPRVVTAERVLILSALFPVLLAYAVIKRDLFDLRLVLRTTTTYGIATVLVVLVYLGVVLVLAVTLGYWTQRYTDLVRHAEAVVVSTLVVVLVFHPLRLGVQRVVDRYFFREAGRAEETVARLGRELAEEAARLPEVAHRLTERVTELARCQFTSLFVCGRGGARLEPVATAGEDRGAVRELTDGLDAAALEWLEALREPTDVGQLTRGAPPVGLQRLMASLGVSMLLPLRSSERLAGVLVLGPRAHGDRYAAFDLRALRGVAPAGALALQYALLVEEHAARERLAALGQLSAVMIHEIKNPLGIIKVSSGTLKRRFVSGDTGHELASFIEDEVDRMNRTIGQFLSFARPQPPRLVRLDLADVARRVATALIPEFAQAGVTVRCELPGPLPALADADHLTQVLMNLLLNAKQALEGRQGGGMAWVSGGRSPGGRSGTVELRVGNDGPAIPEAARDRIFEPFFSSRPGGTGLGLAIARQLLREMGGRIDVASAAEATEFRVALPALEEDGEGSSARSPVVRTVTPK
ncbi:MAG: hypothetical protein IT371_17645 [Deltaproteobacteria bacterium]|nr:hypothetical protein [Deltaproteobacteria bacterium]